MPFLQPNITSVTWTGPNALRVRFTSTCVGCHHQLYIGRQFVGETGTTIEREIVASYDPGDYPEHLTILAVSGSDVGVDHGGKLPRIPVARARISFDTTGWPSDTKIIEVASNTAEGGAVDDSNIVGQIPWEGIATYEFLSDPREWGDHTFRIRGRDNRPTDGNAGTETDVNIATTSYPADVQISNGARLSVSVASSTAEISWSL